MVISRSSRVILSYCTDTLTLLVAGDHDRESSAPCGFQRCFFCDLAAAFLSTLRNAMPAVGLEPRNFSVGAVPLTNHGAPSSLRSFLSSVYSRRSPSKTSLCPLFLHGPPPLVLHEPCLRCSELVLRGHTVTDFAT